jgi:P pilus assembly chaperone PapD
VRARVHPRNPRWLIGALLVTSAALIATSVPARAEGTVTVAVAPTEIALVTGAAATVVVIVTNGTTRALSSVALDPLPSSATLTYEVVTPLPSSLTPGASAEATVKVKRQSQGAGQDAVISFRVHLAVAADTGSPTTQVITATLKVTAAAALTIVTAKAESTAAAISEQRPARGALVISNPTDEVIRVKEIKVTSADDVEVVLICPGQAGATGAAAGAQCVLDVAAHSQEVLPLELRSPASVIPGPRTVVLRVTATHPSGVTGAAVAVMPITVEIFGETEILKAVGLPIFLFLPGVLLILATWFTLRLASPWRARIPPLAPANSGVLATGGLVALGGVLLSLIAAKAYPVLTARFVPGVARDYTAAYGLSDFVYIAAYCLAAAVILLLVSYVVDALARVFRWLFVPGANDRPQDILRKLALRSIRGRTQFPRVSVDGKGGLALSEGRASAFVSPVIVATVPVGEKNKVERYATENQALRLWLALNSAGTAWKTGDFAAPLTTPRASYTTDGQRGALVELA